MCVCVCVCVCVCARPSLHMCGGCVRCPPVCALCGRISSSMYVCCMVSRKDTSPSTSNACTHLLSISTHAPRRGENVPPADLQAVPHQPSSSGSEAGTLAVSWFVVASTFVLCTRYTCVPGPRPCGDSAHACNRLCTRMWELRVVYMRMGHMPVWLANLHSMHCPSFLLTHTHTHIRTFLLPAAAVLQVQ